MQPASAGRARAALLRFAAHLPFFAAVAWLMFRQVAVLRHLGIGVGAELRLAATGASLLALSGLRLLGGRRQLVALLATDAAISLLLFADLLHYRQFDDFTSLGELRYALQLGTVSSSVGALFRPLDLVVFAGLPALPLLLAALPARAREACLRPSTRGTVAALLVTGAGLHALAMHRDAKTLSWTLLGDSLVYERLGALSYHAHDAVSYARRSIAKLGRHEIELAAARARFDREPAPASPLAGVARGRSVIVVQVESLQAFALDLEIGGAPVLPGLRALAAESLHFTEAYAQNGPANTADADLVAHCSLYPSQTGAVYYDHAGNDFRCTPELLAERGYRTVAFQSMPADFWNLATVYPQIGIATFFSKRDFAQDEKIGLALSDASFFRQSFEKLRAVPEPRYAFLVTMTSHHPFDFPEVPRELPFPPELAGTPAAEYLHHVRYADAQLARFVEALRADGTLDRSVLVVYGDHAGIQRHNSNLAALLGLASTDEAALLRAERRVPLLIRLPHGAHAGRRDHLAGQLDLAPTLAGLLGLPAERRFFFGRDLLAAPPSRVLLPDGTVISRERLYLPGAGAEGSPGRCFAVPGSAPLPFARCEALAAEAGRELALSRAIIERDLLDELLASEPPPVPPPTASLPATPPARGPELVEGR